MTIKIRKLLVQNSDDCNDNICDYEGRNSDDDDDDDTDSSDTGRNSNRN